jgi:hypothetical protein
MAYTPLVYDTTAYVKAQLGDMPAVAATRQPASS